MCNRAIETSEGKTIVCKCRICTYSVHGIVTLATVECEKCAAGFVWSRKDGTWVK